MITYLRFSFAFPCTIYVTCRLSISGSDSHSLMEELDMFDDQKVKQKIFNNLYLIFQCLLQGLKCQ